jgi:hypothetical protein
VEVGAPNAGAVSQAALDVAQLSFSKGGGTGPAESELNYRERLCHKGRHGRFGSPLRFHGHPDDPLSPRTSPRLGTQLAHRPAVRSLIRFLCILSTGHRIANRRPLSGLSTKWSRPS